MFRRRTATVGLVAHARLHLAPLAIQPVELLGERDGLRRVVGQQAADADGHVVDAAGGVQPRRDLVPEMARGQVLEPATGDARERHQPCGSGTGAAAAQSLLHEDAVVAVERHEIRHRAECDEVEQVRHCRQASPAAGLEFARDRRHQVEGDANPGQRAAAETGARKIRIHVRRALRQVRRRQVMIGDQHLHAERVRRLDAGKRRDAVVDGDQQVGLRGCEIGNQRRRQAIAVAHAVRDAEADLFVTEPLQLAHHERGAGRAVRVEIADHEDPGAAREMIQQHGGRLADAIERRDRQQAAQLERQVVGLHDDRARHTRAAAPDASLRAAHRPRPAASA